LNKRAAETRAVLEAGLPTLTRFRGDCWPWVGEVRASAVGISVGEAKSG
jgi:hypothetical protein